MAQNPVGWFEIYVQDMKRAKTFYEAVFKAKLERLESPGGMELEMWAFPMTMESPGALVKMPGVPSGGNSTQVYFTCADCAAEAGRVSKAGGRMRKTNFPSASAASLPWPMTPKAICLGCTR